MMKATVLVTALMTVTLSAQAQVAVIQDTTEFAHVLNYSPMPGPQIPRQVCSPVTVTQERVVTSGGSSVGGALVGGVLGAVVGSRFGGGHGRDAATVAGAIGGSMIGGNMGSEPRSSYEPVTTTQTQCHTVYEAGPPSGYQVTYDYKGKLYTTILRSPPGEYLRVRNRITVE